MNKIFLCWLVFWTFTVSILQSPQAGAAPTPEEILDGINRLPAVERKARLEREATPSPCHGRWVAHKEISSADLGEKAILVPFPAKWGDREKELAMIFDQFILKMEKR